MMRLSVFILSSLISFLLIQILGSCGSSLSEKDIKSIQEEKSKRTIKMVNPADIQTAALNKGKVVIKDLQSAISTRLTVSLASKGEEATIENYHKMRQSLIDSISRVNDVTIRSIIPGKADEANEIESAILEAYLFNEDNNLELTDNVQNIDDDQLLYTSPLVLDQVLCLQCHGSDEIREKQKLLDKYFSPYQFSGYKMGSFMGMWSIKFPKKEIVRDL